MPQSSQSAQNVPSGQSSQFAQPPQSPQSVPPWSYTPESLAQEPVLGEAVSSYQPRITPSPPRRKPVGAILIGLLAGLIVFGPTGYVAGTLFSDRKVDTPGSAKSTSPEPVPTSSLSGYEASQLTLNRAKFKGDLAVLAEPWLAHVGGCLDNTESRGPELQIGEEVRIYCRYSGVAVYFVQYKSMTDLDKVNLARRKQNIDAMTMAPGAAPVTKKPSASGKSNGNYIEFAYKGPTEDPQVTVGIWWDKEDAPVAAYLEAPWVEGLGERWEPLRDIWQRYS